MPSRILTNFSSYCRVQVQLRIPARHRYATTIITMVAMAIATPTPVIAPQSAAVAPPLQAFYRIAFKHRRRSAVFHKGSPLRLPRDSALFVITAGPHNGEVY